MTMKKTIAVSLAFALGGHAALAHPDHDGPRRPPPPAPVQPSVIDEDTAKVRGKEEVVRLVSVNKLIESWKDSARFVAIKKTTAADNWEWQLTFDNDAIKVKKRLYIFLKPSGEFVAANFTGK